MGAFTGKQQGGLQNVLGQFAQGALGKKAEEMGCDPALISGIMGLLSGGGGGGDDGASGKLKQCQLRNVGLCFCLVE
jgi:hypothetical protein